MRAKAGELIRFGVVGALATLTHFLLLSALVEYADINPTSANGASFLCAVFVTYIGQSLWVFRGRKRSDLSSLLRFMVSLSITLFANVAIMALTTQVFELGYRIGFLISCLIVPVLSFFINKTWVFSPVSSRVWPSGKCAPKR